jgi:hypothetical protein
MVCAFNEGTGTLGFENVSSGHRNTKCPTDLLGFTVVHLMSPFSWMWCHIILWLVANVLRWCGGFIIKGQNVQWRTFWPLKITPPLCLKMLGIYYPVMLHHIPDEEELRSLFPIRPCHVVHVFHSCSLWHNGIFTPSLEKENYLYVCMKQMAKLFWFPVSVLEIATHNRTFHDIEYIRPCTQVKLWCKQRKKKTGMSNSVLWVRFTNASFIAFCVFSAWSE